MTLLATTVGCASWSERERRAEDEAYALGIEVGRQRTWAELNGGVKRPKVSRGPLFVRMPTPERRRGAVVIGPSEQVVIVRPGAWEEPPQPEGGHERESIP